MSSSVEYHYSIIGGPPVETDHPGRTIAPDNVTVVFVGEKFKQLSISGQCMESPLIRITSRYKNAKDIPAWAARYLDQTDPEQSGPEQTDGGTTED